MRDLKALRESKGFEKCRHCGANNSKTLKYCKHCGHRLVKRSTQGAGSENPKTQTRVGGRCRGYLETKLGLQEPKNQILPIEGVNLSMMALLAEEDKRKRTKARFIKRVMIASCLTGAIGGYYWYDQQDLRAAKTAYAKDQLETLRTLKQEMSFEDWQKFEQTQVSDVVGWVQSAKKGKRSPQDVESKIEQLLQIIDDESLKATLKEQNQLIEVVLKDEVAYQQGIDALAEGEQLTAYKAFLSISETYSRSKEVQTRLEDLKPSALKEWKVYLQELLEAKRYTEMVEESTLYLSIQPKDANVVAMKKQAEQGVQNQPQEQPVQSNPESKPKPDREGQSQSGEKPESETVEVETDQRESTSKEEEGEKETEDKETVVGEDVAKIKYLPLKNEQTLRVDQTKLHFTLNRLTPTIWPDKVTSSSNSFESEAGTVYFVFLFGVTNDGNEKLVLNELIQGASVTDGEGTTYDQFAGFYTETPEKLSPVHDWSMLEPGESATLHVVIQVPKELKTRVTPLTARIQIKDQWYQKEIPAQ